MKVASYFQNNMFLNEEKPIQKINFLYYLLYAPLVKVIGVDKDAPRMIGESFEDYINRRGLPPLSGIKFNKNNIFSVNDQRAELIRIGKKYESREKQYEFLTYRWEEYDKLMEKINSTPYVNKRDKEGFTPLHRAVLKRNLAELKELLKVPGINVNLYNTNSHYGIYASKYMNQFTALGLAIKKEYHEIVEELLKAPGIDKKKLEYIE